MKIRGFDVLKGDGSLNDAFYHQCLLKVATGKADAFTDAEQNQLKEYRAPDGKNIAHLFMKSILLSLYEESSKEVALSNLMLKTFPSLFTEKDKNGNTAFEYLLSDEIMKDGEVVKYIAESDSYNQFSYHHLFLDVLFIFLNKGESIEKCTSHNSVLGYLIKNESKAIPPIVIRFLLFMLIPLRDVNNALKKWNIMKGNFHIDEAYTLENNSDKAPEVFKAEWMKDKIRRNELNNILYTYCTDQIKKEKAEYKNHINYIVKYILCVSNNHEMKDLEANFNPINTIISLVNNYIGLLFNTPKAEFNKFNQEEITFLIQEFIAAGANLDIQSARYGETALMYAAGDNHTKCVKALVAAGAKLDIKNKHGETALIYAAGNNHTKCAKTIVAAGAKLDIQNNGGDTALIYAAYKGNTECVKALVAAGAKLDIQDKAGETALIYCKEHGYMEIAAIIEKRTTYKLMLKSLGSVQLKSVVAEAQTTRIEQNQENNAAEYQCTSAAIQSTGRNVHSASGYQRD